jgi:Fanconi anemia group M protein
MAIIVADSRETKSTMIQQLKAMEGIEVMVKELSSGDYILHENTVVERKSAIDFVQSIKDQRLFQQIEKMKLEYATPMILIEGDVFRTRSDMKHKAIAGAISYITAIRGINLVTLANPQETAMMLATMARHLQEGLDYVVPIRTGKPKTSDLMSRYLVEGLAGVGPNNAAMLLNHFGSALAAFNASIADLCAIKGMGKTTAQRIYDALRHEVQRTQVPPL